MEISLEVDKETVLRLYGTQYKYVILHGNGKYTWEFVPQKSMFGDHGNRILTVPRDQLQHLTGMYQQHLSCIALFYLHNYIFVFTALANSFFPLLSLCCHIPLLSKWSSTGIL